MKIVVFSYEAGIATTLFVWYDEYRRPRGRSVTKKKTPLPTVPRRGPEVGVIRIDYNFRGSGVKRIDSSLFFSRAIFFMYFSPLLILL